MSATLEAGSVRDARAHATAPGEAHRASLVEFLRVLDSGGRELDAIVASAARVLDAPVAAINALVGDQQHLLARVGTDLRVLPRELSLCTHVTARRVQLVLRDASRDPYFARNPLVTVDGSGFRSYCGVPIMADDGTCIAVLCVLDSVARDFGREHGEALQEIAKVAAGVLQRDLQRDMSPAVQPEAVLDVDRVPVLATRLPQGDVLELDQDPLYRWIDETVPADARPDRPLAGRVRGWFARRARAAHVVG